MTKAEALQALRCCLPEKHGGNADGCRSCPLDIVCTDEALTLNLPMTLVEAVAALLDDEEEDP